MTAQQNTTQSSGRYIIPIEIISSTPLLVGNPVSAFHTEFIKDQNGLPMIPGSTVAGNLKSIWPNADESIWGTASDINSGSQSKIICYDWTLISKDIHVENYEGNSLDHNRGVAKHQELYSFEHLPAGARFYGEIHLIFNGEMKESKKRFEVFQQNLANTLYSEDFTLGRMPNAGYGRIAHIDSNHATEPAIHSYFVNYNNDLATWLEILKNRQTSKFYNKDLFAKLTDSPTIYTYNVPKKKEDTIAFEGTFNLINAMMIGGGSHANAQKAYKTLNGAPFISSKSVAGAIKARMRMWCLTLDLQSTDAYLGASLAKHDETIAQANNDQKGSIRSRFRMLNADYISHSDKQPIDQVQPRIAIDSFTGSTKNTALFASAPLWQEKEHELIIGFQAQIKSPNETAVFLKTIRDLALGDLAIGGEKNIGRGRLSLRKATLQLGDESFQIEEKDKSLDINFKENFAISLKQFIQLNEKTHA